MSDQPVYDPPERAAIYEALAATWPAAAVAMLDGWTIRDGAGGGSRVSAATGRGDIARAELAMRDLGQVPLFMICEDDEDLDAALAAQGYAVKDEVVIYAAAVAALASQPAPELAAIPAAAPLAIQREIWAAGGIGPARLDVMHRASNPKTYFMARHNARPAGTAFMSIHGGIAMLHALEITPECRGQGAGRAATCAAAKWALDQGAAHIALMCTTANTAANALYQSIGMQICGRYHYRIKA